MQSSGLHTELTSAEITAFEERVMEEPSFERNVFERDRENDVALGELEKKSFHTWQTWPTCHPFPPLQCKNDSQKGRHLA